MEKIIEERFLAIDFGLKRIGLALTDPLKIIAYPFKTILNGKKSIDEIITLINGNNINRLIVGYPLKENGNKYDLTLKVEQFCKEIQSKIKIEIIFRDERYTSQIAYSNVLESVNKKSARRDKGLIDKNAASIILSEYLEEIKNK
jgi:putative holliday junction resolvase